MLTIVALAWMTWDVRTGTISPPEAAAFAVTAPLQRAAGVIARPARRVATAVADQATLHERLGRLRSADDRLRTARAVNADLAAENAALRQLVGMSRRVPRPTIAAPVVGVPPGDAAAGLVVAAGSDRGVAPGAAVLDPSGALVGRVALVTRRHARVALVTSPAGRVAVRTVPGRLPGRLRGTGGGPLALTLDDPRRGVPAGRRVVTRAHAGSAVPDGIPVGVVTGRRAGPGAFAVRPLVRVARLDLVAVVVDDRGGSSPASQRPPLSPASQHPRLSPSAP